jgi:flagellar hook-length control protein FliK
MPSTPVSSQQTASVPVSKSDNFATLLTSLVGQDTGTKSSAGATATKTDPSKQADPGAILSALVQILSGQSEASADTGQTADSTGPVQNQTTGASLASAIDQIIHSLKDSSTTRQPGQILLTTPTSLTGEMAGNQASSPGALSENATGGAVNLLELIEASLNQLQTGGSLQAQQQGVASPSASTSPLQTAVMAAAAGNATLTATVLAGNVRPADSKATIPQQQPQQVNITATIAPPYSGSQNSTIKGTVTTAPKQQGQAGDLSGSAADAQVRAALLPKTEPALASGGQLTNALQTTQFAAGETSNLVSQPLLQQSSASAMTTGLQQTADNTETAGTGMISQIIASAHLAANANNASMSIQLKPEWLGDLKLVVNLDQGIVNAHFIAQNQITAGLIQSRLPELKQALNDQGISWQHLSVSSGGSQGNQQGSSQSQQNTGRTQAQYDYGSGSSPDNDVQPIIPTAYQWGGAGSFNYVV